MALDHYISQVYLRKFYAPDLGGLMYAVRKSDLKTFTPNSESICRIEDNSTNGYLEDPRAIENLLRVIEPKYNSALRKFALGEISAGDIFVISGFIAYINTCSPAAMRLGVPHLKSMLEEVSLIADREGKFDKPPESLGAESFTELLQQNLISITVDEKYPQAIGIKSIISLIQSYGNFDWEVLHNEFVDLPFITSDFPLVVEPTRDLRVINRVFPLSPYLAVRIMPKLHLKRELCDMSFKYFRFRKRSLSRREVRQFNLSIIQCAEDLVLSSRNSALNKKLVSEFSTSKVVSKEAKLPLGNGSFLISYLRVGE